MFRDATGESHIGPIALVGAAIVAVLAIGADPRSIGDTQAAMPASE